MSQGFWANGKRDGLFKMYHLYITNHSVLEHHAYFSGDSHNGQTKHFHDNGKLLFVRNSETNGLGKFSIHYKKNGEIDIDASPSLRP